MSIYKPKGLFNAEVVDPESLSQEWIEAQQIIDSTTSWQFISSDNSNLQYDNLSRTIGSGAITMQKQRWGYTGGGRSQNDDASYIKTNLPTGVGDQRAWIIPYMKGFQEVWEGDIALEWTSSYPELVLIGYSTWAYRLSSESENNNNVQGKTIYYGGSFFGSDTLPRTKLGLKLDGTIIEGSGPGTNVATNAPESVVGAGSREKGICTSSVFVKRLRAGTHRLSPVAGQGPAQKREMNSEDSAYWKSGTNTKTEDFNYFSGISDSSDTKFEQPNVGVAVVNSRVFALRFPLGKLLGD